MAAGDDLLLTRVEAAERLRVSVQTVRRLAESGHLAEVQVSARAVRVRAASVDRLVREGLPRRRWVREYRSLGSPCARCLAGRYAAGRDPARLSGSLPVDDALVQRAYE
jgi:excisionase family DNA binding protein